MCENFEYIAYLKVTKRTDFKSSHCKKKDFVTRYGNES